MATRHLLHAEVFTNFADKLRSIDRFSPLQTEGHGICFLFCVKLLQRPVVLSDGERSATLLQSLSLSLYETTERSSITIFFNVELLQ
jgi:hypothetical protein